MYGTIADSVRNITGVDMCTLAEKEQLQLILDMGLCTLPELYKLNTRRRSIIEHHIRRLCYALHSARYYHMCKLPTRKRDGL